MRVPEGDLGFAPEDRVRHGNSLEGSVQVLQAFGSVAHEPVDIPSTHRELVAYQLVPGIILQERLDFIQDRRDGIDTIEVVQIDPGASHQELGMLLRGRWREERKPAIEHVPLVGIESFVSVPSDQTCGPPHIFGRQSVLDRFLVQAFVFKPQAGPQV